MSGKGTYIVTGGAGFIGSCIVRTLNDKGIEDIIIVDDIASTAKWKNIQNKKYREYIHKKNFMGLLEQEEYENISAVIHMGACSSTTELDFDYLWENNVGYSKALWRYCARKQIPFLYASSAATYGVGEKGFSDDTAGIDALRPLNAYGYSKQVFDQWSLKQEEKPSQYVGLKFFNVYGPNEYFKGSMASMVFHGFNQLKETGKIRLFRSGDKNYTDGGQERDFVYVKDVCNVISYFLEHPEYSGIFNVGTGRAQTFSELASAIFYALDREPVIEYFEMPKELEGKYQYHTEADITSLRRAGYSFPFADVKRGVEDYVRNFLIPGYMTY